MEEEHIGGGDDEPWETERRRTNYVQLKGKDCDSCLTVDGGNSAALYHFFRLNN